MNYSIHGEITETVRNFRQKLAKAVVKELKLNLPYPAEDWLIREFSFVNGKLSFMFYRHPCDA